MKVLLKEDVDNLGYAGDVCKVANGYGRNYLIPKGYAVLATNSVLKQATQWREQAAARREQLRSEYEALCTRLTNVTLNFTVKAGAKGRLYGSVTTHEITEQLNTNLGTEIDRRKVISEPLRELGEHNVLVRLSGEYQERIKVILQREEDKEESVVTKPTPTVEETVDTSAEWENFGEEELEE